MRADTHGVTLRLRVVVLRSGIGCTVCVTQPDRRSFLEFSGVSVSYFLLEVDFGSFGDGILHSMLGSAETVLLERIVTEQTGMCDRFVFQDCRT